MAFKRSAVRSRLSPPFKALKHFMFQGFLLCLFQVLSVLLPILSLYSHIALSLFLHSSFCALIHKKPDFICVFNSGYISKPCLVVFYACHSTLRQALSQFTQFKSAEKAADATFSFMVRAWGLEPQRLSTQEPKSCMSTNSIMPACQARSSVRALCICNKWILSHIAGKCNINSSKYAHIIIALSKAVVFACQTFATL